MNYYFILITAILLFFLFFAMIKDGATQFAKGQVRFGLIILDILFGGIGLAFTAFMVSYASAKIFPY
jgi:hypothetical protein